MGLVTSLVTLFAGAVIGCIGYLAKKFDWWNSYIKFLRKRKWLGSLPKSYRRAAKVVCEFVGNQKILSAKRELYVFSPTETDFRYFFEHSRDGLRLNDVSPTFLEHEDFYSISKLLSRLSALLGCDNLVDGYKNRLNKEDQSYRTELITEREATPISARAYDGIKKSDTVKIAKGATRSAVIFSPYLADEHSFTTDLIKQISRDLSELSEHRLTIIYLTRQADSSDISLPIIAVNSNGIRTCCQELQQKMIDFDQWSPEIFYGRKTIGVGDVEQIFRRSKEKSVPPTQYLTDRAAWYASRTETILTATSQAKLFHEEFSVRLIEIRQSLATSLSECGKSWRRLFLHARHLGAFDRCQYLINLARIWLEENSQGDDNLLGAYAALHGGEILHEIARESGQTRDITRGSEIKSHYETALCFFKNRSQTDEAYTLNNLAICESEFLNDKEGRKKHMLEALNIVENIKNSPNTCILILCNFYADNPRSITKKHLDQLHSANTTDPWFKFARYEFKIAYENSLGDSQAASASIMGLIELVENNKWLAGRGNFLTIIRELKSRVPKKIRKRALALAQEGKIYVEKMRSFSQTMA